MAGAHSKLQYVLLGHLLVNIHTYTLKGMLPQPQDTAWCVKQYAC